MIWPWDPGWVWPWEPFITGKSGAELWRVRNEPQLPMPKLSPPAPQTEAKMRTWTPEDLWEALAQYRAGWAAGLAQSAQLTPPTSSPQQKSAATWLWVAAGLAALALMLLAAGRPRLALIGR